MPYAALYIFLKKKNYKNFHTRYSHVVVDTSMNHTKTSALAHFVITDASMHVRVNVKCYLTHTNSDFTKLSKNLFYKAPNHHHISLLHASTFSTDSVCFSTSTAFSPIYIKTQPRLTTTSSITTKEHNN